MSEFLPTLSLSEFKKLKASQIRELKSIEVISDGVYLFTAIIPHGDDFTRDYMRTQADYLGLKSNIPGGKDPEEEESLAPV